MKGEMLRRLSMILVSRGYDCLSSASVVVMVMTVAVMMMAMMVVTMAMAMVVMAVMVMAMLVALYHNSSGSVVERRVSTKLEVIVCERCTSLRTERADGPEHNQREDEHQRRAGHSQLEDNLREGSQREGSQREDSPQEGIPREEHRTREDGHRRAEEDGSGL